MDTRVIATEYRMAQRTRALKERAANGESITDFCKKKGVSRNTYFYWQRKLREAACNELSKLEAPAVRLAATAFTEVKVVESVVPPADLVESQQSQIRLEVSGINITTDSRYPMDKLTALLRELRRP